MGTQLYLLLVPAHQLRTELGLARSQLRTAPELRLSGERHGAWHQDCPTAKVSLLVAQSSVCAFATPIALVIFDW